MTVSFARFAVDVGMRWYHGGIGDLAAGVTFWILVSLPAAVLALLAMLEAIKPVVDFSFRIEIEATVLEFVDQVFRENAAVRETVRDLFQQDPNSGLIIVSLVVALWSISRGFAGMLRALDDIYDVVDTRVWYHTRVVAILLGLGSLVITVPIVMIDRLVWSRMADGPIEELLRSTTAFAMLVVWASTIFHYGPTQRSLWQHNIPGAVTTAAGWMVLSQGFSTYVDLSSEANEVTAAVGGYLLAITWLWLAAQVLLIGGTVNYLYGQRRDIDRTRRSWWMTNGS